jgi:transcription termination factor NusB
MATRRQGREWALQLLFQADMNPGLDLDMSIPKFWRQQYTCKVEEAEKRDAELPQSTKPVEDRVAPPKIREFTEKLVRGVLGHLEEIDDKLVAYTQNWPLHRMGSVERNVLRLAFYELLYCQRRAASRGAERGDRSGQVFQQHGFGPLCQRHP